MRFSTELSEIIWNPGLWRSVKMEYILICHKYVFSQVRKIVSIEDLPRRVNQ